MFYPINKSRNDVNYYVAAFGRRYYSSLTNSNSYDIFGICGGGFDFESMGTDMELITVTNEMDVTDIVENEKKVEEEVELNKTVDCPEV